MYLKLTCNLTIRFKAGIKLEFRLSAGTSIQTRTPLVSFLVTLAAAAYHYVTVWPYTVYGW